MPAKAHLALTVLTLVLATLLLLEWRSERRDRAALQATLDAAQKSLEQASANQQQRDKQLTNTVAKLETLKATVRTKKQILARLPEVLPLPTPLTMDQPAATAATTSPDAALLAQPILAVQGNLPPSHQSSESAPAKGASEAPTTAAPTDLTLPTEDLKPLYDFAVDCRACQAKLSAETADLADEKTKTEALSRERDAALKLAKGGSLRQRFGRALKWFAIGATVGFVASKSH